MITLTRRDIARGQLESAILLWFLEKDPVAIHVLATAALEVIHGVGSKKGKPSLIKSVSKAFPKSFQKQVAMPQNFFKHATTDPNCVLEFLPEISEYFMFDGVLSYERVFHDLTPLMRTFAARFIVSQRETLGEFPKKLYEGFPADQFGGAGRQEFLEKGLEFLTGRE